jgi:hypothetical protein
MKRSVIATALEMFHFEQAPKYRGRCRAREMATALRPVEAKPQVGSAPRRRYSKIAQPALAGFCHIGSSIGTADEPLLFQGIGQCHSQAAGEVSVAGSCEPQRVGTARSIRARVARAARDIGQRGQRASHLLVGDAVISELPLCDDREDAGIANFCRCALAPEGLKPAAVASSPAGNAHPPTSAASIASRAGSARAAAIGEKPASVVILATSDRCSSSSSRRRSVVSGFSETCLATPA